MVSVLGQTIRVPNPSAIYTGNLSKGVYIVRISKGREIMTQKVLVYKSAYQ
ncbi:MAG: T9SS type A sorting domain-containing protein [Candidatus Symbiothrix sp.]|nr:T9SS type A sorting domain-containing protein [Candidatus Symbiothrix sp.]